MKVNFVTRSGPHLASHRLRTMVAASAFADSVIGPCVSADVHVFSKHWDRGDVELASRTRSVYDVCDEHFTSTPDAIAAYPWIREHYRRMCEVAKVVTCGSEELARIIKEKTGRDAVVIEEPCEDGELEPRFAPEGPLKLLWFGHAANLKHLKPLLPSITDELEIVSNAAGTTPWTPGNQAAALERCDLVILPQSERWKSANRAVTALRAGRYAVADDVPSYEGICWTRGVLEGIEWVRQNPGSITERIRSSQRLIRERFSLSRIRRQWFDCISGAAGSTFPDSST